LTVKCIGKHFYLGNFFLVTVCYSDHVRFSVINNMMAALSNIENEMYRVHQIVKKQKLTLVDMWRK